MIYSRYFWLLALFFISLRLFGTTKRVVEIEILNANYTQEHQIMRNLLFRVGDIIDREKITNSLWLLNNDDLWQNVTISLVVKNANVKFSSGKLWDNQSVEPVIVYIQVEEKNPLMFLPLGFPLITSDREARHVVSFSYLLTQGQLVYRGQNLFGEDINFSYLQNFVAGVQFFKVKDYFLSFNPWQNMSSGLKFNRLFDTQHSFELKTEYGKPLREYYSNTQLRGVYQAQVLNQKIRFNYNFIDIFSLGRYITLSFDYEYRLNETIQSISGILPSAHNDYLNGYGGELQISSRRFSNSIFHITLKTPFHYYEDINNNRNSFTLFSFILNFSLNLPSFQLDLQGGYHGSLKEVPYYMQYSMVSANYIKLLSNAKVRGYFTDQGLHEVGYYGNFQIGIPVAYKISALLFLDIGKSIKSSVNGDFLFYSMGVGAGLDVSSKAKLQVFVILNRDKIISTLAGVKRRI